MSTESKIQEKTESHIRFLKYYSIVVTVLFTSLFFFSFKNEQNTKNFEEINVERINIVEKDGSLKMVISNRERQHPGIVNGKEIERKGKRPPGILFFNQNGDEMGGLVYGANGKNGHFGSLTWDKFKGDQTIGFRHLEGGNGRYSSGISMWQQPDVPGDIIASKIDSVRNITDSELRKKAFQELRDKNLLATNRMFIGKSRNGSSLLEMNDAKGNVRITISVNNNGNPELKFFDENGNAIYSIPN